MENQCFTNDQMDVSFKCLTLATVCADTPGGGEAGMASPCYVVSRVADRLRNCGQVTHFGLFLST